VRYSVPSHGADNRSFQTETRALFVPPKQQRPPPPGRQRSRIN
jgi:hypothetical protein